MGTTNRRRPRGWNAALNEYATAQRAGNRSPGTIRLHRHYLRNLAELHPRSPWSPSTPDLAAFIGQDRWAPETRKSARASVRAFYRWALGMAYVEEDPAATLLSIRVPEGVPRPAPEHVIRQVLRNGAERTGFMVLLAAELGMRCAEIARVHEQDYLALEPVPGPGMS